MEIRDRAFVVTGAGNGIGREVVRGLLARGARVAAVDVRAESLDETARLATATPERLSTHVLDLSDRGAVEALPEEVESAHGQVDGLLNVAGIIQQFVPFNDLDWAEIEKVLAVNLWGVLHTTKAFLPRLLERPEACVVNVSSMGGFVPVPGQTIYGASKAAVKLFTEGLYAEMRGTNVAVTVVFPGAIGTDIARNSGVGIPGGEAAAEAAAAQARTTSPTVAADAIIEAVRDGSYRVLIGSDATMLDRISRLAPQRATDMVAKKMASLLG
ncbi:MAG: SDR family oxidoreductase [Nocardioidaceae bacterium]